MDGRPESVVEVVLSCGDLAAGVDYYAGELEFRLESIFPADAPRVATLSGYGIRVRLHSGQAAQETATALPANEPSLVVTDYDPATFAVGRAGMQYRDLVRGRYGGRFVASHIRIPEGGPVPDYVHYHDVRFQLIYCLRGWVRVVYEDQGPPMRLEPGDCFLQPPLIRHRVLECSDALEVVEISCPAEHETFVEHDMDLPTPVAVPDREFGGQRFVFHQARGARWQPWTAAGLMYRDTGIADATNGIAAAITVQRSGVAGRVPLQHDAGIRFLFVVRGSADLLCDGGVLATLGTHSAAAIPPNLRGTLERISDDFEMLEVTARD